MASFSVSSSSELSPFLTRPIQSVPNKQEAQRIFWALGDRFWMQMIDGVFHHYGPLVFDQGLHGGHAEPGFFASLKAGCEYASDHLTEKLTIEFYLHLHRQLCSHFRGPTNNTEISVEFTGMFKELACECSLRLFNFDDSHRHYFYVHMYRGDISENSLLTDAQKDRLYEETDEVFLHRYLWDVVEGSTWAIKLAKEWQFVTNKREIIEREYRSSHIWIENWVRQWRERVMALNAYITRLCFSLNVPKFIDIKMIDGNSVVFGYDCVDSSTQYGILEKLFNNYNATIDQINLKLQMITVFPQETRRLQHQKIEAIAFLYQLLEWFHPVQDGQGRTDLVLMAKLLCEQGECPAILANPYLSTYASFSQWKEALAEGMLAWRKEAGLI